MKATVVGRLVRALAVAVPVALAAPASAQAFSLAPSISLTGTYTLVHVDGTAGHRGRDAYRPVLRVGNLAYDVALRGGMAFRSGDTVRFGGRLDGRTLRASSAHIESFVSDHAQVAGTTKVLVVLAEWAGQDTMTTTKAAGVFDSDNTWFQQTSYGHLSLATTVAGWVHVPTPTAGVCTNSSAAYKLTNDALAAAGYSASSFNRVVVYFPGGSTGCSGIAGFAEVPGSHVWLNGTMDVRSSVHEQGHNYGLYHAHSAVCTAPGTTTPTAAPDAAADNCTYSDYGDPFDAMGASGYAAEYSAGQKQVLGWLDVGRTATLTPAAPVALVPYEEQSASVHAASYAASASRTYWFENRSATGPDASLPLGATTGVLLHVTDATVATASGQTSATPQSFVLDESPADHTLSTAVLPYGQSWTSPEGVTFTIGTPAGGTVTVSASTGTDTGTGTPVGTGTGTGTGTSTTTTPPPPPATAVLTAELGSLAATTTVAQGSRVTVEGSAQRVDGSAAAGLPMWLQAAPHGTASWRTVATVPTLSNGAASIALVALGTSDYRWHVDASATEAGADSNVVTVVVRPYLRAATTRTTVRHGQTVGLDVFAPGHAGQVVQVQRWSRNAWHRYLSVRLGATAKRMVTVRLAAKGGYRFRFVIAADADHLRGTSKTLSVRAT